MKNLLITITVILLAGWNCMAQAPDDLWAKTYGGTENEQARDMVQTYDSAFIIVGSASSNNYDVHNNHGNSDFWIVKLNIYGDTLWTKTLGGSSYDYANSAIQTFDSCLVIAGATYSVDGSVHGNHGDSDYWIVKLDIIGDTLWTKTLGGTDEDEATCIQQTNDSGYIVAGFTFSNDGDVHGNHGFYDFWLVKLNPDGDTLWTKTFGGSHTEKVNAIVETSDGSILVAGYTQSDDGDVYDKHEMADGWVVKLNPNGETLWAKCLGGSGTDRFNSIFENDEGDIILAGYTWSDDGDVNINHGNADVWIVKLNISGDVLWTKTYGGSKSDEAQSIKQTKDGGYITAGHSRSNDYDVHENKGMNDYLIVRIENNGDTLWTKTMGGSLEESAQSINQTFKGDYLIAGSTHSEDGDVYGNRYYDYWVVRLAENQLDCPHPTDLSSVSVASTAVNLSWSEKGTATSWQLKLDTADFNPDLATAINVTTNPFKFSGLLPEKDYDWYVKSDCIGDDQSFWVGPGKFQTTCSAKTAPFYDGYESQEQYQWEWGDCWISTNPHIPQNIWRPREGPLNFGNSGYIFGANSGSWYAVTMTSYSELYSPYIDISGLDTPGLSFFYFILGGATVKLYVDVHDGESWNNVLAIINGQQQNQSTDNWLQKTIDLTSYQDTVRIRFRSEKDISHGGVCIDDILIDELPFCLWPSYQLVSNISDVSADLTWTENGSATAWQIILDTVGFDTTGAVPISVYENPYTWNDLIPGVQYEWYVRSECSENIFSGWRGPSVFWTNCVENFSAPLIEDFETTEIGEIPDCWRTINTNPEKFSIGVAGSSNKGMRFEIDEPFGPLMLITPRLDDLTQKDKQISFFAVFPWSVLYGSPPTISVGTISNPTDPETYTEFREIELSDVLSEYTIEFDSSYNLSDKYLAFKSGRTRGTKFDAYTYKETFIDNITYQKITDQNLYPATLPFIEDFELSDGQRVNNGKMFYETDRKWNFTVNQDHVSRIDWGKYGLSYSGEGAMVKKTLYDFVTSSPILTLNMENYQLSSDLELSLYYFYNEPDWADNKEDIFVRGSLDDEWLLLYSFNLDSLEKEIYHFIDGLDIDEILVSASPKQEVSSTFQLKFESQMEFGSSVIYDLINITGTIPEMDGFFIDSDQLIGTSGHTDVALGDVDGDGDLDAVVTKDGQGEPNKVWLNDGEGIFTDSRMNFGQSKSWGVALGDLDGDGDLDGFMANDGPNKVYLNDGANTTDNGQNLGTMVSSGVQLADLDGDGDLDAVVTNKPIGEPNKLWLNDGNGMFSDAGLSFGYAKSYGIALGDLDGDGDIDGFVANYGANKVYINEGASTSDNGQNLGTGYTTDVKLGDVDGDGDLDAVVANKFVYQSNYLWINDGTGDFLPSGINLGYDISMGIALGDLDLDGDLDAFVANSGPNKVFLNDGVNTTDNGQLLGTGDSYGIALGDLDDDGDLDAFVANYDGPCKVWINQTLHNTEGDKRDNASFQDIEVPQSEYSLVNYPNPFRHSTTIQFMVPETGYSRICVYNSFGKLVRELYNDVADKNKTITMIFNSEFLPSGIYFLRMQHGGTIINEKMVVL